MNTTRQLLMKSIKTNVFSKFTQIVKNSFSSKYLLYTNIAISVSTSGVGDVIEQQIEIYRGKLEKWNRVRTFNMSVSGLTIGIFVHYWYIYLDRYMPGYTLRIVMKKILLDQLICSPVTIWALFVTVGMLERKSAKQILDEMKEKALILYSAEWVIWPTAQFINFYFLPTRYRLLYDSNISLFYDIFTSYVKNADSNSDNEKKEDS